MFLWIVYRLKGDHFSWTIVKFAISISGSHKVMLFDTTIFLYSLVFVLIFPIIMKTIVMEVLGGCMLGDGERGIVKITKKDQFSANMRSETKL